MLKKLKEKKNALKLQMKGILDKAQENGEVRALTEEEQKEFDRLENEIKALEATIARMEKVEDDKIEKTDPAEDAGSEEKTEKEKQEERAFGNYIRGIVEERADVNLTKSDNGAVIPTSIADKIITKIKEICPIYEMADRYEVGGTLTIPYYDESTQKITMAYADEFTDLNSTSGQFKSIELKGFLAGALTKISKSLVNNSKFDIVNFTIGAIAEAARQWIEGELLNGTSNKVAGLASGVTQVVTAASSTAVTCDELMDVQDKVPDAFQGDAIWIMNRATRSAIRKLKDNDGKYLLNPDVSAKWGYTLLGKDVYCSDNMSGMAAGKTAIYYGSMKGLALKISEDIDVQILNEQFATQHAVGVMAWVELDAKVQNAQMLSALKMKASA